MPKQRKPDKASKSDATEPVAANSVAAPAIQAAAGDSLTPAPETSPAPTSSASSVSSADALPDDPSSRTPHADLLLQPSKAELATARQAAAEPAFAGLVAAKQTIPRQPVPTESEAMPAAAGSRTKAWRIATGAAAVVAFAAAVFAVSASESTDVLADTLPKASPAATPAASGPPPAYLSVGTGPTAGLLIVPDGHVLYYNDQDGAPPNGVPACVDACAQAWSPLVPPAGIPLVAGPGVVGFVYTTVRPDGSTQITFNGHPLYEFTVDGPGNVTGNNLTDVFNGRAFSWHAVSATDTPVIPSPSASPSLLLPPTPSLSPSPPTSPAPSR